MRHAKSDWSNSNLSDFDRPLNNRGKKAASKMGLELKKRNIIPDLILSSPAKRAKTTADLFAQSNNYKQNITLINNFYLSTENTIINEMSCLDNKINTVMIVGHNPTMETLIQELTDYKVNKKMPTAAITILKAKLENWQEIFETNFDLGNYLIPKEL